MFVKEKVKKRRRFRTWEIVLLALGSPIWLSLLITLFAVIISLYAVIWSLVVTFWAVFASFAGGFVGGVVLGVVYIALGNTLSGIAIIGAAIVLAGLAIFAFLGCLYATRGVARLTKKALLALKGRMARKEDER